MTNQPKRAGAIAAAVVALLLAGGPAPAAIRDGTADANTITGTHNANHITGDAGNDRCRVGPDGGTTRRCE